MIDHAPCKWHNWIDSNWPLSQLHLPVGVCHTLAMASVRAQSRSGVRWLSATHWLLLVISEQIFARRGVYGLVDSHQDERSLMENCTCHCLCLGHSCTEVTAPHSIGIVIYRHFINYCITTHWSSVTHCAAPEGTIFCFAGKFIPFMAVKWTVKFCCAGRRLWHMTRIRQWPLTL